MNRTVHNATPADEPRRSTLTTGPRSQFWLGLAMTFGPMLLTFAAIYGLAWVLAVRTPLARAPEWLAWPVGVVASALVVFGLPLALLLWGFRKYRG